MRSRKSRTIATPSQATPGSHALRSLRRGVRGRLASSLIASVILIVIAGFITLSWVGYVTHSMQSATRERERLAALLAAESGIDLVVDWMNNPRHFEEFLALSQSLETQSNHDLVRLIDTYATVYLDESTSVQRLLEWTTAHPARYELEIPKVRQDYEYSAFEPFVRDYVKDYDGTPLTRTAKPILNVHNLSWISPYSADDLVTTLFTFFFPGPEVDLFAINWADASRRSKVPSMIIAFDDAVDPAALRGIMPQREFRLGRDPNNAAEVGTEIARLESIELIHPSQFDIPATARFAVVTKVVATGISRSGIRSTVETLLTENRIPDIRSPGAILAPSGVVFNSNVHVHWGEIWTHEPSLLVNNWVNHVPVYETGRDFGAYQGQRKWDPWFRYRTRSVFIDSADKFADIRANGGFKDTPTASNDHPYFRMPFFWDGPRGQQTNSFRYYHNMLQNQSITIMSRQYDEWKQLFHDFNLPYYYTDTQGRVWGRERDKTLPTYGEYVPKSYEAWFHCDPEDPEYWEFDRLFAFIDSVPRNDQGQATTPGVINREFYPRDPTKAPAINWPDAGMATVKDSGQSTHTRGVIFAATNLDLTGAGSPPVWTRIKFDDGTHMVQLPDGRTPDQSLLRKNQQDIGISHNGLIHTWGVMKNAGNRTIYGSIHAERGLEADPDYGAGGTPSVYYNFRMNDGSWLTLNQSRVRRANWDIVAINRVDMGG